MSLGGHAEAAGRRAWRSTTRLGAGITAPARFLWDTASHVPLSTRGLPRGEVPLEAIGALTVLAANYARQNVRRAPHNLVSLGRTTLGGRHDAHGTTRSVLAGALDDAWGTGWPRHVARPAWPEDHDGVRRAGLVRVARSRRRYTDLHDQQYGLDSSSVLDLWRHPDLPPDARAPIVLQIPGGAWIMGSKRGQAYPLMHHLVERGWICASLSYRLAPRNPWPAQILDVKLALAWLKEHAPEFGGDPAAVAVTGGSAGGHLAALTALSAGDPELQPGFEEADTSVIAAVPLYGRYDWVSEEGEGRREFMNFLEGVVVQRRRSAAPFLFEAASPLHRDLAHAPPFFVVHGRNDTIIPVEQARAFAAALRTRSHQPVAYAELPLAQHGFDLLASRRTTEVCEAVTDFLGLVLDARAAALRPSRRRR